MLSAKPQMVDKKMDMETKKLELYRLLGEGYKAMEEGRESTLDEVVEKLEQRRAERRG